VRGQSRIYHRGTSTPAPRRRLRSGSSGVPNQVEWDWFRSDSVNTTLAGLGTEGHNTPEIHSDHIGAGIIIGCVDGPDSGAGADIEVRRRPGSDGRFVEVSNEPERDFVVEIFFFFV
jgi:hypothetical protein